MDAPGALTASKGFQFLMGERHMNEIRSSTDHERDSRGRYSPGTSGNPNGRPPGIKDKRVTSREELLGPILPEAIEKLHVAVKEGERWAIEMVVAYSLPKPKPVDSEEMAEFEERLLELEDIALGH